MIVMIFSTCKSTNFMIYSAKYKLQNHLFFRALSSSLVEVNIGLLEHNIGITTADTLDGCQGELHLALAIDVSTNNTENVLEFLWYDQ